MKPSFIIFFLILNVQLLGQKPLFDTLTIDPGTKIIGRYPQYDKSRAYEKYNFIIEDSTKIAEFIKKYPNNKNTPFLQRKLNSMTGSGNAAAKPSIQPLNTEKLEKQVEKSEAKVEPDAKAKRTAEVLTHLFNNDPNKKDAYVLIRNKSECNLIVKFVGKNSII